MRGKCDACGYFDTPVEECGEFDPARLRRPVFCEVCRTTHASQIVTNPESLRSNPLLLYRSFALMANMVLDAIHELRHGGKR